MKQLPWLLTLAVLLMCLLANPAPVSAETIDIFLMLPVFLIALTGITGLKNWILRPPDALLLFAVCWYLAFLLVTALTGLLHGNSLAAVLRSTGPYICFVPLMLAGFLPGNLFSLPRIALCLTVAGLCQCVWLLYLYVHYAGQAHSTLDVLRYRITLRDPRTTLPLMLAPAILPLLMIFRKTNKKNAKTQFYFKQDVMPGLLMLTALFAAIMTLTRALLLSMLAGWLVFFLLYFYHCMTRPAQQLLYFIKKIFFGLTVSVILISLLSQIPAIHVMQQGLAARFQGEAHTDYSDGRLYNEWGPALAAWQHSGTSGLLFGIGAGTPFTVLTGEERTYIHNLSLYALVYGGLFGFTGCIMLHAVLFRTLALRAAQADNAFLFAWPALLAALFFYGQLFAVHKGLAFNAMLFVLVAAALTHPQNGSGQ